MSVKPIGLRHTDVREEVPTAAPDRIRLVVLSAVRLYREGLADYLTRDTRLAVVAVAAGYDDGGAAVRAHEPAVALVDAAGTDALALVRALRALAPGLRIVVLAISGDRDVLEWAEAGISGYVTRDASLHDLVEAVVAAARGEAFCEPHVSAALLERVHTLAATRPAPAAVAKLTAREREIAALLAQRLSNKQIGTRLHIEVTTVKNHVHNILEKLHVSGRAEAAAALQSAGVGTTVLSAEHEN